MKQTMRPTTGQGHRVVLGFLLCAGLLLGVANPAEAQQNNKKNKNAPASNADPTTLMNDQQQVDYLISNMLGAWQFGDAAKLHESYADDVIIVSGIYAPPVVGWANYAPLFTQQRQRMQHVRWDRSNTYIKVVGTFAWACYQWDFSASIDGVESGSRGQTTLVFQKRDGHWLIVHNQTSQLEARVAPSGAGGAPPASQPPANKPASP